MNKDNKKQSDFVVVSDGEECSVITTESSWIDGAEEYHFRTAGYCMLPFIEPGDEIELDTTSGPAKPGWIMTFRWGDRIYTHRVIKTERKRFWARGDLSDGIQGPIASHDVVGRVIAVWRDGQRYRLSGIRQRYYGILRNHAMAAARRSARAFPGLRGLTAVVLLSSPVISRLLSGILGLISGGIELVEEDDPKKVFSHLLTTGGQNIAEIAKTENDVDRCAIRIFHARTTKHGLSIGSIQLYQAGIDPGHIIWLVKAFYSYVPEKFIGGDRAIVAEFERIALKAKINRIVFELYERDQRLARVLNFLGFDRVESRFETSWMADLCIHLEEGKIWYHKNLEKI